MDPGFRAQGLEGGTVTLKCSSPAGMRFGLSPQDEREILDDARLGILSGHKKVEIMPTTQGETRPTYCFEVYVTSDQSEQRVKRYRGPRSLRAVSVYVNVTRVRVRRTIRARYTVIHLPSGRVVWQADGEACGTSYHRLNLINYYGRPELRPNLGPPLSEILSPVTEKACRQLP